MKEESADNDGGLVASRVGQSEGGFCYFAQKCAFNLHAISSLLS